MGCINRSDIFPATGKAWDLAAYSEPVLKRKAATPAPRAQATRPTPVSKNFFERIVEQVRTWVQSRVAAIKLNRALLPFIGKARDEASASLTGKHFEKLASALAFATTVKDGSNGLIDKVVRNSVKGLTLEQQSALRKQFEGKPTEDRFLLALEDCVQNAAIAKGQDNLAEGLEIFAQYSAPPFDVERAADAVQHSLETILDLARSDTELPLRDQFRSASTIIAGENVQSWFKRQPPAQQLRIRCNLRATASDLTMAESSRRSDRLLQAFCASILDTLPPARKR
jgi:hypothetical protein